MKRKFITTAMLFAALCLSIETSAKGPPGKTVLLKDANGVTIGRVIGMETVGWPYVLTQEGYRTFFRSGNGKVSLVPDDGVYYKTADCTGNAYVSRGMYLGTVFSPTPQLDQVYGEGAPYPPLYIPHEEPKVTDDVFSVLTIDGCELLDPPEYGANGYPAYPNDPAVTGIQNTAYPTRLLIE